jgi:hypothetical protein
MNSRRRIASPGDYGLTIKRLKLAHSKGIADVAVGSFATKVEPATSATMSAMPRKRPNFAAQGNVAMGQKATLATNPIKRRSGLLVFCNGADCGDYSSGLSSWNRRQLRLKEALYELRLTKMGARLSNRAGGKPSTP